MRRMRMLAAAGGVMAVAAAALPATAADVTVALNNPGGSRTVFVENLLGQELTTLDFGTSRAQPFRVRVVDATMDRNGFQVLSTMTNLYKATGPSSYDFATLIPSSNASINYPATPLNAQNVAGVVVPVFDLTETVTGTLCTTLTTLSAAIPGATPCAITLSGLQGVRQTLTQTVNLADLTALPLVPQAGDTGAFANPSYAGIAAAAPQPPSPPAATSVRLLSGGLGSVFTGLQTALAGVVGAATSVTDLVPAGTVTTALRNFLTGAVWDALSVTDQQALVNGLVATARTLGAAEVVAQSGTYLGFPQLNVNVPTAAGAGDYRGTLVVTSVQT